MWPTLKMLRLTLSRMTARKAPPRRRPAFRRSRLEALEDRTLLSPLLTLNNLAVSGSNGAVVKNGGTWSDSISGATITLSASAGTVTQNTGGTWSWSETTPGGASQTAPVTIYAKDNSGATAAVEFWLNVGQVFLVTNTLNDGSAGSFPWAVNQVNNDTSDSAAQPDLIAFDITAASDAAAGGTGYSPRTGVAAILRGATPRITMPVVMDGYTQPGASPNTLLGVQLPAPGSPPTTQPQGDNAVLKVQVDLSNAGGNAHGLGLYANNSTVRGLVLNGIAVDSPAIRVEGTGDHVEGNFIGTDLTGTQVAGNAGLGILLAGSNAVVGGTTPDARNIVSGNGNSSSVLYQDQGGILDLGTGDIVQGNFLGTDVSGKIALGNGGLGGFGVGVNGVNDTIGGSAPGAGNLVSGNQFGIAGGFGNEEIQGNLIGTDVTGTSALGNGWGIGFNGAPIIGGNSITNPAARNVISGNGIGIVDQSNSSLAVIEGNYIGTDITGTKAVAGDGIGDGVWLFGGATLGGTAPGDGNVISISGNGVGVRISGNSSTVQGNLIGTDYTGTKAVGVNIGIFLVGGDNNVIGGLDTNAPGAPLAGGGNLISGCGEAAIALSNGSGNVIEGNYIGTDITGTQAIGNGGGAVSIGASNSTVGGTAAGSGNIIGYSGDDGVFVGGGATGVSILGNSISASRPLGIHLDAASNANDNQAAPVLTAAYAASGATIVTGTLTSTPSATFHLEFFANAAGDPEGRTLLGGQSVTTDASGHGGFTAFLSALPAGQGLLTATATDPNSNTSQFSAGVIATPLPPSSLSGVVWEDFNNDGQVDFGENGISGVTITLTGTDFLGNPVNLPQQTDSDGAYVFPNLYPGNYYLTETQPAGYVQGIDSVGTAGGSLVDTDRFSVSLGVGVNGLNYNYGERPATTGPVQKGQTAGIGFWNNKNGQALIKAFDGGTGHQLGDWLAATLPNIFGAHAGSNNLTGQSNAYIAALFQQDFVLKGVKLDAQVLATALSVYATNATLDNTQVASQYGFTVSGDGVGTATVNVGSNGDAFGVANNTTMTVLDLLLATDEQAVNGVLYNGNQTKRSHANNVYSFVNQAGNIN